MPVVILSGALNTDKPFALWDNVLVGGSFTGVPNAAAGYPFTNSTDPMTWSKWVQSQPNSNQVTIDFGSFKQFDSIAFAAHELGSVGAEISFAESPDNVTYTTIMGFTSFSSNDATTFLFSPRDARYVRITLRYGPAPVGIIFIGKKFTFPHPPIDSYTPIYQAKQYTKLFNASRTGEFLGNKVISEKAETTIDLGFVDRSFVKTPEFLAFKDHYDRGGTFFFGSWPAGEPNDTGYCRSLTEDGTVQVEYIEADKLANISFDVRAYV